MGLIEGFPKSKESLESFTSQVGACKAAILFECSEEEKKKLAASSSDEAAYMKRVEAYEIANKTMIEFFESQNKLLRLQLSDGDDIVCKTACEQLPAFGIAAAKGGNKSVCLLMGNQDFPEMKQLAAALVAKFGFTHLTQRKLFEQEVKSNSDTGQQLHTMMKDKKIIPPKMTIDLLQSTIAKEVGPFLLEGFPKSKEHMQL